MSSNLQEKSELKETSLQITGMTCAACANRIEKGLNKLEGVEEASVNLALERSVIKYDPSIVSEQEFEKKIVDLRLRSSKREKGIHYYWYDLRSLCY